MAVDTRNKRSAAIGVARPWMVRFPLADGTIDASDRRHVAYAYEAYTTVVIGVGVYTKLIGDQNGYTKLVSDSNDN